MDRCGEIATHGGVKRVKWLIPSLPACFVSPDPFNVT